MSKDTLLLEHWEKWNGAFECGYSARQYPASQLRQLADQLAQQLRLAGIQAGDIVALILANTVAFPVSLLATLKLGANPLLLHASTTKEELEKLNGKIRIQWLIHDYIPSLSRINPEDYMVRDRFAIGNIDLHIYPLRNDPTGQAKSIPETGVILHQTSGTYGNPLICLRNQEVAIAEAVNYVSTIRIYDQIRIRFTTPLNHAFAYGFGLMAAIITDSTLIVDTAFNPKKVLAAETERTSDILAIVPPMIHSMIYLKQANPNYVLPKVIYYAGTRCNDTLRDDLEKAFDTKLFSIYGTTETGAIANNNRDFSRKSGVGPVLNNVDVQIRYPEKYQDLGGQIGEIFVKATSMMQRYFFDEISTTIDYFPTGDIGYMDSEKNIQITGRIRDVINVGGIKVDPVEIENVILSHPDITDAAVYPGQSEAGEEIILSAISIRNPNLDLADLNSFCAEQLNYYKIPKQFITLEKIPRTASGKCLKASLPGYAKLIVN